jgi:hypothetical protein
MGFSRRWSRQRLSPSILGTQRLIPHRINTPCDHQTFVLAPWCPCPLDAPSWPQTAPAGYRPPAPATANDVTQGSKHQHSQDDPRDLDKVHHVGLRRGRSDRYASDVADVGCQGKGLPPLRLVGAANAGPTTVLRELWMPWLFMASLFNQFFPSSYVGAGAGLSAVPLANALRTRTPPQGGSPRVFQSRWGMRQTVRA